MNNAEATPISDSEETHPETSGRFLDHVKPFSAALAMVQFMFDKENTALVFKVFDYLDGPQSEKNFQRFKATEHGQQILAKGVDLAAVLSDREMLSRLPPGTLGYEYYQFTREEDIDANGLVMAEETAGVQTLHLEPQRRLYMSTGFQLHDVWHVLAGYGRDLVGESCVLAFTYGQLSIRGTYLFGLLMGLKERVHNLDVPVFKIQGEAKRLGEQAEWLVVQDWPALLATPLEDVRKRLNIGQPIFYNRYKERLTARDKIRRTSLRQRKAQDSPQSKDV